MPTTQSEQSEWDLADSMADEWNLDDCDEDSQPTRKVPPQAEVVRHVKGDTPLFFDLETTPDFSRLHTFNLPPVPEPPAILELDKCPVVDRFLDCTLAELKTRLAAINPCAEWLEALEAAEQAKEKPRSGLRDAVQDKRAAQAAAANAKAERIKLLSVTPEYCSIAALGWAVGRGDVESLVTGAPFDGTDAVNDERLLLHTFWKLAEDHSPLIGFNILHFDLPVIFIRSAILGVAPTRSLDLRPWGKDVIDVFALRFPKGKSSGAPGRLKELAPLMGIPVPAGDVDGSCVNDLMQAEQFEQVAKYVESDIEVTRAYHRALRGFFWS